MYNPYDNIKYITASISFVYFLTVGSLSINSVMGIVLFVFFATKLFFDIGYKIEIRDIMILLAVVQWIIGPLLAYNYYPDNEFYYMAVSEDIYIDYVFFATFMFTIGLYIPLRTNNINENIYLINIKKLLLKNKNLDLIFIAIGVVSELILDSVPLGLRFLIYLFSGLRFIGLYFLFLSNRPHKNIIVYVMLVWLFLAALKYGMFHDLILWLIFFLMIVAFITKPSLNKKIVFTFLFVFLIFTLQTIKHEYRQLLSGNKSKAELFADVVQKTMFESDYFKSDANTRAMVTRMNQGWIIARIMNWTPENEPFANGETIEDAIIATLLPRILFPDKIEAGGRTYFERFTGKKINDNTSMGLSLLGEAYANYGVLGGSVFMLIIGFFYNFVIFMIFRLARSRAYLIFFIPLIFLQVVKAETDFAVILNHLFKSSIAVVMIIWGIKNILGLKI